MNKSLLKQATVDNPEPNALFITNQIQKMSNISTEVCQSLEEWLLNALENNSPHVKRKVLLIIKSVAKNGNEDFSKNIISKTEIIKKNASIFIL
jgi:hypothetical protein